MPDDRGFPQDNSERPHISQARQGQGLDAEGGRGTATRGAMMSKPRLFTCAMCRGEKWFIIADEGTTGYVQFRCATPSCKACVPVVQLQKPQVDSGVLRRLGLVTPAKFRNMRPLEFILEDDENQ